MVHAARIDTTHTPCTRALVLALLRCVFPQRVAALPTSIRVTVHAYILDEGKMCLVKIEVQCVRVLTYRSTDEFGSCLSILCIRFDELVHAHVGLERGLFTIEIIQRDPGKFFHGYIVLVVSLVQRLNRRFQ